MRRLFIDGTELAYRERGEGELAVFIHGFPLDHRIWLDQLDALADMRRCVAPDLRGFGESEPLREEALTMELLAADIAGLIEGLGVDQADVVGLSMGGYVALALWEEAPELFRSLVLVDTRAEADTPDGKQRRDDTARAVVEKGRQWLASDSLPNLLADQASTSARGRVRTMIEGVPYETIAAALVGMRDRPDRRFLLHSISVPVLVVVGQDDLVTPPEAAWAMVDQIPGARLVEIPDAGHLSPVEQPEDVSAALRGFFETLAQ